MTVESKLRIRLDAIASELAHIQQELAKLQQRQTALDAQHKLVVEILSDIDGTEHGKQAASVARRPAAASAGKVRPVDAVLSALADNPQGLTAKQITDALETRIDTASDSPRAIIRNTIHNLAKKQKIAKDERTGVYTATT